MYINIYIYREREREIYIYVYIYIYAKQPCIVERDAVCAQKAPKKGDA